MHIRDKYPPAWLGSFVRRLHGSGPDKRTRPRADQSIRPSFGQSGRPCPVCRISRPYCAAQVVSGVMRAVRAQRIRTKDKPNSGSRYISQRMHNRTHILHKFCAIALAGVALCAKQMMRAQPDHALSPGMRLRTRKPITVARTALMTAVGMNGSTHAVTPAAIELFMSTQNIAVPTT